MLKAVWNGAVIAEGDRTARRLLARRERGALTAV